MRRDRKGEKKTGRNDDVTVRSKSDRLTLACLQVSFRKNRGGPLWIMNKR